MNYKKYFSKKFDLVRILDNVGKIFNANIRHNFF
jgi:hypothetical protein